MHALVTGSAGFIGSHLTERLLAEGHFVRAVDSLTPYYDIEQKLANLRVMASVPTCEFIELDLRTADLDSVLEGIDVVFHQAGQPGVRASWASGFTKYVEQNILVTQRLLEATRRVGVQRFVFASSSSVYGNAPSYPTTEEDLPRPQSPYGVTKLAAEQLCGVYGRNWGVPTVSLRYFTVYGPRQRPDMAIHRLIEAALAQRPFPIFGNGHQVRDFTFVDDVVESNLLAASANLVPGTTLNVSGNEEVTLVGVIEIVEELVGLRLTLDRRGAQAGDVERTGGATERANRLLGWRPAVSLREGLAKQVDWHTKRRAGADASR